MRFEFATANRIIFGPGVIGQAGALARDLGRRALVTTGRDASRAQGMMELLRAANVHTTPLAIAGEPDLEVVRRGAALARQEKCDLVVGFGGGSALDSAKAIAAMLTNDGDALDYLEVIGRGKPLTQPPAPVIAIPTTAGTGSEVTRNSVLSSPEHRVKVSLRSPWMLPKVALVDPDLTRGLPRAITASTGLDALTQLIEPYVSGRANALTDGLCLEGMERAARSLRPAYENGRDAAAREEMAVASLFGGLALANAGLGAVHGLAGVIGGMFDAPHGAICAALLPHVMAANLSALRSRDTSNPALRRFDEVARIITSRSDAMADDGVAWVGKLVGDLKIPKLGTYGMKQADLSGLVEKSKNASSMKANPLLLTNEELSQIMELAI